MKFALLSLALSLSSCMKTPSQTEFLQSWIVHNWVGVSKIESMHSESFEREKSIISPQMTWKNLLKVDLPDGKSHCLFYRIPHKRLSKGRGILRITQAGKNLKCDSSLEKDPLIELDGLSHLKLYFTSNFERNLKLKKSYKAFHLYMSFSREKDKDLNLELPLFNVTPKTMINSKKLNKKKRKYKRYEEPWRSSLRPGMSLYHGSFWPALNMKIHDEVSFNYAENNYRFCYRVDRECKITEEFECDKCKEGWYSVVDNKCPGGGSKLCGTSRCGERNQPACPRGDTYSRLENGSFCYKGSSAGICANGLNTYCDENNILICR